MAPGSRPPPSRTFSIGELARRSSVSVKTLRFWSDEGLLPVKARSASGYRVYGEEALVRLELVRALREVGLGLARIRAVLADELSLEDALRLQLAAVEAHARSLRHVASALRAALRPRSDPAAGRHATDVVPTDHDLRRITAVTRLSRTERTALVERFYDDVTRGASVDPAFKRSMIEASAVELPDDPTPAQLDAWIELGELLEDPAFVASLRRGVEDTWTPGFDLAAWTRASDAMVAEANAALADGVAPDAPAAREVVDRFVAGAAAASGEAPDDAFRARLRRRFLEQDPRAARYWGLVAAVRGTPPPDEDRWPHAAWAWFVAASTAHFP